MPNWNDNTVDWYAEHYGDDPTVFAVVREAAITAQADVLDISCGTGSALRAMRSQTAGRLVGVDPIARMIDHAKDQTPEALAIELVVSAAETLPFEDACFDVALAINAVAHWDDLAKGLAEVHRVLKPGGRCVIGGEVFEEEGENGGPSYEAELRNAGFKTSEHKSIPEGFVEIAVKDAAHV